MKDKLFALLLCLLMLLTMAACASKQAEQEPEVDEPAADTQEPETETEPETEPETEGEVETAPEGDTPAASVDLAAFYDTLFPDPNNAPAVMDLAADAAMLDTFYPGLSEVATNQCHVFMPMMTAVPFEIALVEVADAADIDAVKAILQSRIDTEIENQMNYPAVVENWELNSRIVTNGNYIMMVAYEGCDEFVEAFNALFA